MSSKTVILLVVVVFIAISESSPVESDGQGEVIRADRHRRVTCDLLSLEVNKFKVKDLACSAHCLGMLRGYTSGKCQSGVCHCKK
ncbi:hypothetical protein FQR65_LT07673 [Abscondita terminalis]|nr:hypothetical protein FQR65_LT07673 [Abscondita terminalis]